MSMRAAGLLALSAAILVFVNAGHASVNDARARVKDAADAVISPLMAEHGIPGMAVGIITSEGEFVLNYGVASKEAAKAVTNNTLFEIGSISKTFTATLASSAQLKGKLSLADKVSKHLPELAGSSFDNVSLLNLGTYTPGGLSLQFPAWVTNDRQMIEYFQNWKPAYTPGTHRTYSNPSLGLFGFIAGKRMGADFSAAMRDTLFSALELNSTYLDVPQGKREDYAQGYTRQGKPVRLTGGIRGAEAYGIRTTASDMIRFIAANMGKLDLDEGLERAILETHTGYYKLGAMTQGLVWEHYAYPTTLDDLLAGNSEQVIRKPNPVRPLSPPVPPQDNVWYNKTGSTNGFGAYAAFVPGKSLGIILLANKNYPISARVTAAYRILERLDGTRPPGN